MYRWLTAVVLVSCSDDGMKVYNTPPSAAILNPPDGYEVDEGTVLTFQGLVSDSQDASADLVISLASDLDGVLDDGLAPNAAGEIEYSTANLQPGNHAVTLKAVDTNGDSDEDMVKITIRDVPDEPTISVASPVNGQFGLEGVAFDFRAFVTDRQDPSEDIRVVLSSDSDGDVCSMFVDVSGVAQCTAQLSGGDHFLTFTATDTDALEAKATAYFQVVGLLDQDGDLDTWTENQGDCDDTDPSVHPGAPEYANGADDDCDGLTDEGTLESDDDGDGMSEAGGDCDDTDADIWLGAPELCDGRDNDCDLTVDEGTMCADDDGDGYTEGDGDCDDTASDVHPGAVESADGHDEDCDGYIDEGTSAFDDDGDCTCEVGPCMGTFASGCGALTDGDCDDADYAVNPSGTELCNTMDDDCDGTVDEPDAADALEWYNDSDNDNYGDPGVTSTACTKPAGYVSNADDCDDGSHSSNPSGTETCDGNDNDCDGDTDEGLTLPFYEDADGDGHGDGTVFVEDCSAPAGYAASSDDCDDAAATTYPLANELCDGVDNNCDGSIDEPDAVDGATWFQDDDGDGWGDDVTSTTGCTVPTGYVGIRGDCDDLDPLIDPDTDELCDFIDNDCDGTTDEDDAIDAIYWYDDDDGDGYGAGAAEATACDQPSGTTMVDSFNDCDDGDAWVNPGATETCNGEDDNCDGTADNGVSVTYYRDADGDGYGTPSSTSTGCTPAGGYVSNDDDCNDSNASLSPLTRWYLDADYDTYGTGSYSVQQCTQPAGFADDFSDCNDGNSSIHPYATESCDGSDDDCDGAVDETGASGCTTYYYDYDGDGYGNPATGSTCTCGAAGSWTATNNWDCYDVNAAARPGSTGYYSVNRGDGSFDYNCDGSSSPLYTSNYSCVVNWTGVLCDSNTDGWSTSSDPSCGSTGTWATGCWALFWACAASGSSGLTEICR